MIYQGWVITYEDDMPVLQSRTATNPKWMYVKYEHALLAYLLAHRAAIAGSQCGEVYQEARDRQLIWKAMLNIMDERGIPVVV